MLLSIKTAAICACQSAMKTLLIVLLTCSSNTCRARQEIVMCDASMLIEGITHAA